MVDMRRCIYWYTCYEIRNNKICKSIKELPIHSSGLNKIEVEILSSGLVEKWSNWWL